IMMSKASAAALYFLVTDADPVLGPEFWELLRTGNHSSNDDPVWVFREYLRRYVGADRADRSQRRRTDQKALLSLGIVAWNLWSTCTLAPRGRVRGSDEGQPFLDWVIADGVPEVNRRVTRKPAGS